jgi:hypothetical protein
MPTRKGHRRRVEFVSSYSSYLRLQLECCAGIDVGKKVVVGNDGSVQGKHAETRKNGTNNAKPRTVEKLDEKL